MEIQPALRETKAACDIRLAELGALWDEIARRGGQAREMGGGAIVRRRRRLPGDALVKLEARVRLGEEVEVRLRLEIIVPGRWVS